MELYSALGLGLIFIAGFAIIFIFLNKKLGAPRDEGEQPFVLIQNQMNEIARRLDTQFQESNRLIHGQFASSQGIIKDVTEKLVKIEATNKQMVGFADQLRGLEDILKNPKQRGILGEYLLETLLKNVFPPGKYQMQYPFKNGDIVDAVIFYQEKIIPIDSKFSLENYNRLAGTSDPVEREQFEKAFRQDLKNRIDETAKYVRPEENTLEFAFMFIPAEAIYYDLLVNKIGAGAQDLIAYAMNDKKVIVVSPTSFLAYLQTVLYGMRAIQFHKDAEEIRKRVQDLNRHLNAYQAYFQKIGTHLGTTMNAYNAADKELKKIDKDVLRIGGEGAESEVRLLENSAEEQNTLL